MLCRKIHLTERRSRIPHELNNISEGPIIRPCSTKDINECLTPRQTRTQRLPQNERTPLIVLTLCISPDTQTLAPKDIKRDPRKQPSYCQNFKILSNTYRYTSDDKQSSDSMPDFFIQGIEITEKSTRINDDENMDCIVGNNEELCEENYEILRECTCSEQGENGSRDFELNLDGYEMDNYGHLPGDSRTPTPIRAGFLGSRCRVAAVKRPPSPSTQQVIRVTMNNKPICKKYFL